VAGYVGVGVQTVVALALTPFVIHQIGVESYGIWALVNGLIAFATLLEAPSALAAIKYMSRLHAGREKQERDQLVSNLLAVQLSMSLAVSVAVAGVALFWPNLFCPDPAYAGAAYEVWLVVGGAVALSFPINLSKSLLTGMGRLVEVQVLDTFAALLNGGMVFLALRAGGGVVSLSLASAIALLSAGVVAWIRVAYLLPGLRVSPWYCSRKQLRELVGFGGASFVTNVTMTVVRRIDVLLLAGPLGLGAVAVFQLALRIAEQAQSFLCQLANALTPAMGELFAQKDSERRKVWFLRGSQMSLALALVPCLFLLFYADDLLLWWVGEDFVGAATPLRLFAVALLIGNLEDHAGNVLSMGGKHKALAVCWIVIAVTKVAASLLLLPVMGLAAPAAGTLIGAIVGKVLIELPVALRLIEVRTLRYVRSVLLPTIPAALVGALTLWILSAGSTTGSLALLLLHLIVGAVAFGVVYFAVALPTEVLALMRSLSRRLRPTSAPIGAADSPESVEPGMSRQAV